MACGWGGAKLKKDRPGYNGIVGREDRGGGMTPF